MLRSLVGHWAGYVAHPIASILVVVALTTACQSSMLRQFDQVKPGMEKDDVLSLMGSPKQTQRFHGKDRWFYTFYDNRIHFEKEVQFFEGNAVYVGDVWQPPVAQSAASQDTVNAQKNRDVDEQIATDLQTHRKEYDSYESKAKGEDKVRYVPVFEPVR